MSDLAIRCEGIAKQYRIGQRESYRALRDSLSNAVTAPASASKDSPATATTSP